MRQVDADPKFAEVSKMTDILGTYLRNCISRDLEADEHFQPDVP